jgi:hypothetical protein
VNEIIKTANLPSTALLPKNLEEAMKLAEVLSKSDIVPKDYQGKPGNILVAVQWGMEIGLGPLQALQNIASINGRPALWGDAMLALVRGSGLLVSINETITDSTATCAVHRVGEEPTARTFSMEDAKRAGLSGKQGPWQQYPKRMLQMRARGWALRDVFPDVLKGLACAEEERDRTERDITPKSAPAAVMEALGIAGPTLDEIRDRINAAETDAQMKAIARDAKALPPDELSLVKELWGMKKAVLAERATVDTETGEVKE